MAGRESLLTAAKHLLLTVISLIFTPVVALAILSAVSFVIIVFLPCYLAVAALAKVTRPDLISPVFGDSVMFTAASPDKCLGNLTHLVPLDGVISTDALCQRFIQRVVNRRTEGSEDPKENLMFYRYRYTWTCFLGYNFWQPETDFRAESHVREYDLEGELQLPYPRHEKDVLSKYGALAGQPWKRGRSPWEFLVIQDYRTESEPEVPRTAMLLRHHHALVDGYGIASVIREFSGCPYAMPGINIKISFVAKLWAYMRIPYDISVVMATKLFSCGFLHKSSNSWPTPTGVMGELEIQFSEPINVQAVKEIKDRLGVSFLAVNFASLTGALKRMLDEEGLESSYQVPIIFPVPKSDHPGGTNVQLILIPITLPLNATNATERVAHIQQALNSLYATSWPLISDWIVTYAGLLPVVLTRKVFEGVERTGPGPVIFTSFPGNTDVVHIEGKELLEVITSLGSKPSVGPTVIVSGANGKQRFAVTLNTANWKLSNSHKLGTYVNEELGCLLERNKSVNCV